MSSPQPEGEYGCLRQKPAVSATGNYNRPRFLDIFPPWSQRRNAVYDGRLPRTRKPHQDRDRQVSHASTKDDTYIHRLKDTTSTMYLEITKAHATPSVESARRINPLLTKVRAKSRLVHIVASFEAKLLHVRRIIGFS